MAYCPSPTFCSLVYRYLIAGGDIFLVLQLLGRHVWNDLQAWCQQAIGQTPHLVTATARPTILTRACRRKRRRHPRLCRRICSRQPRQHVLHAVRSCTTTRPPGSTMSRRPSSCAVLLASIISLHRLHLHHPPKHSPISPSRRTTKSWA